MSDTKAAEALIYNNSCLYSFMCLVFLVFLFSRFLLSFLVGVHI